MKSHKIGLIAALALLAGCAGAPAPRYFTLDTGQTSGTPQGRTPSIVITQTSLPELIDRPQLVIRRPDNRVLIDEHRRWAEPLRRAIPRVMANELGRQLDSNRVVSLPIDAQGFDADFRLSLDVQHLEVVEGLGAQADIVWRLQPRQGKAVVGRSVLREAGSLDDAAALVAMQGRVLGAVASEIAEQVRQMMRAAS